MQIKIEDLAPKKILNFYLPKILTANGEAVVLNKNTESKGLLKNLMQANGVTRLLLAGDILSLQYDCDNADDIRALTLAELDDFFTQNTMEQFVSSAVNKEKIEALADALIRPTLNRDNGDINILSLQDGVLVLEFTGHCAGCPYAQNTLHNVIIKTIRRYIPQIHEVKLKEK